ncbi:ABC-type sugar transport system ATPase component [Gaiella occulta]|uniref:ABC-type sugar transport system ATPase component n=1 Tax=Gaiella occulta TaxID=1002870 RepID=A0A7M2YVT5_9ACTN|nr:ABC-type sugar transport system ATPase component [Gaiella occulta]
MHKSGWKCCKRAGRVRAVAEITLDRLAKVYPDGTRAVVGLDMEVADGEFVVFVGPSGCGKTSALRMIAGLEEITEGTVTIGGEVVNELPPKNRDVAMVFQNYALYPHMSVFDNMGFALKMRGFERGEIARRVNDAAKALGLVEVLRKRPRTLSGGQRQRVAMGRAIVREPQAFLMDEPLSNLDAKLRVQMRAEIARIQRSLGTTTIYVTHDQSEAMTLGDRVAVMRRGELQQLDPPQRLYEEPVNLFVAEFIGSPAMNLVEAVLAWENGAARVRFGEHELPLDAETLTRRPGLASYDGRRLALGIRPEDLGDAALEGVPEDRRIPVTIDLREDMGAEVFLHFGVDATAVETEDVKEAQEDDVAQGLRFIARVARESRAREGERIDLSIDTRRLRFFDLETGQAIL